MSEEEADGDLDLLSEAARPDIAQNDGFSDGHLPVIEQID